MSTPADAADARNRPGHLDMRLAWQRFLRDIEPDRPRLFRYCRRLAGNVWDAEDLVQDTLLKTFGSLGTLDEGPTQWGAYMARIASNLWIDQKRRKQPQALDAVAEPSEPGSAEAAASLRDGGRVLLTQLSPQERCAVVMKEAFGFTIGEIAGLLGTSEGAIKAALHRGRGKLAEPVPSERSAPSEALVQRFVDAFNAGDVEAITATMLESVTAQVFALGTGHGLDEISKPDRWIRVCLEGHESNPDRHQRAERVVYGGEPIVILWRHYGDGNEKLEEVWRFREDSGRIAHIWDYCACPETLAEIATELGAPFETRDYGEYHDVLH